MRLGCVPFPCCRLRILHEAGLFDEGAESGTDRDLMARLIGVTASVEDSIVAVQEVSNPWQVGGWDTTLGVAGLKVNASQASSHV